MSPRPMASRNDETAAAFLDAGSALIDAMLATDRGAHLTDTSVPLPVRVRNVAWGIAAGLLNDPRASLFSHAAVMVNHDPLTAQVVA